MPSITLRLMLKMEARLTKITSFHWSGVILCNMASRVMPALLTSTSMGPSSASTSLIARAASANSPTLPFTIMTPCSAAAFFAASSLPA